MKKISKLLLLPLALLACTACTENYIDDLDGTFDLPRYTYTDVQTQSTKKMGKGIKQLNFTLSGQQGGPMAITLGSSEWQLPGGTYDPVASAADVKTAGKYYATIGGSAVKEGTLNVTDEGGVYRINGILTCDDAKRYVINFRGEITLEQGVDDPEASGYKATMVVSQLTTTDPNTWPPVPVDGMSKYSFVITDPSGAEVGFVDALNSSGIAVTALGGEYTVQGNSTSPWFVDNGWVYPDWGMAGGTFFVRADGSKAYVTTGKIRLEFVKGMEGEQLVSFTGNGLGTVNADGSQGAAFNLSIKYAEVVVP